MTERATALRQKSLPLLMPALVAPARREQEAASAAIPLFGHHFGQVSPRQPQAKLTVSQPGDPQEQEAERTADQVMRSDTLSVPKDGEREGEAKGDGLPLARQVMRAPGDAPPPADPAPSGDPNTPPADPGSTPIPLNGSNAGGGATNISIHPTTRSLSAPNLSQLWDVMTQSGTRESASVLPKLKPDPQYEYDGNNRVTKVVVTVVENKEMPQWTDLPQQCPPIQVEWNRFFSILDTHENNHIAIDKKHFTNLHARLIGKEQSVAWKIVDDEITAADQENSDYDTKSAHGVNEGANINSAVQCAPEKIKSTSAGGPGDDIPDPNPDPSLAPALPPTAQAKLLVSRPGDPWEQEADSIADRVMRMMTPTVQRTCAGPGLCDCPECRKRQEEQKAYRKASEDSVAEDEIAEDAAPLVCEAVGRGGGQPLDGPARAFLEPRFGHDFSRIRIHTDQRAARSAIAVNARAYTVGNDVVFGSGQYAPDSAAGRHLLAHELTHTIQQGQSPALVQRVGFYSPPGPPPTPDTLPPVPGSPTTPIGPIPLGQYDGQLIATWGWAWKTKLTADRRDARDFDTLAKASAFGASIAPAAVFQEDSKFVVYHMKYTALHSFTYDNAKINTDGTDCDMRAVTPVAAIITEDGVPILPHQLKGEDGKPKDDYNSPMEAKDTLKPGEDPFAAHKDVFGQGLGSVTDRDAFVKQFEVAMRDAAISALDRSQRDAEQKQKDMAGGALPAGDKDKIASVAKRLVEVEAKLDQTRFMAMPRRGPNAEEEHQADEEAKAAKVKELTEERAKIRLEYPILSQVDASDFLKKGEKEQAQMLGGAADEVLKNIKITRDNVLTGSLKLWAVPSLVQSTQAGLGITDDGRKKWVSEKVSQEGKDAKEVQQALGVFQIAFSIAAVALGGPVGAAFAVGALGVSMADALITTQQYAQDQAAAGTDVNKDKALVPADLTGRWFTLVVAWVGVGLSYADAVYWVRNIKTGAVTIEEATSALAKDKNVDEGALKSAAKGADSHVALDSGKIRGEVHFETPTGETHEYKLYDDGRMLRCSDACDLPSFNFRQRLAEIRSVLLPDSAARAEAAALTAEAQAIEKDAAAWALKSEAEKESGKAALLQRGEQIENKMAGIEKKALPELGANAKQAMDDVTKLLDTHPTLKGEFSEDLREINKKYESIKKDAGDPGILKDKDLRHAAGEDLVSLQAKAQELTERINAKLGNSEARPYVPSPKHAEGGWGTPMDLDDATAQAVLNGGISNGKQVYAYHDGKLYEFQPDNVGGYHGYPVPGTEVPPAILKDMEDSGLLSAADRNKFRKDSGEN